MAGGDIGIAESYLRGEWESPDLTRFLELFCVNQPMITRLLEGRPLIVRHAADASALDCVRTRSGDRSITSTPITDLGNAFYSQWLDSSDDLFVGARSCR